MADGAEDGSGDRGRDGGVDAAELVVLYDGAFVGGQEEEGVAVHAGVRRDHRAGQAVVGDSGKPVALRLVEGAVGGHHPDRCVLAFAAGLTGAIACQEAGLGVDELAVLVDRAGELSPSRPQTSLQVE